MQKMGTWAVAVAAWAMVACGDDSTPSGSGGGGQGGSGGGTPSSTTGTQQTTSTGGGGQGGSGGGADACEGDEPTPITFTIRNDSDQRLWFQGAGYGPTLLASIAVDGNAVPACPCDDPSACAIAVASISTNVGYLEPGESFEEVWVGLFYDPVEANPECAEQRYCHVGRAPEPATRTASATAYLGAPRCDAPCDCDLADGNVCNFGEAAETPTDPVDATAVFSFPDETSVEIAFTL